MNEHKRRTFEAWGEHPLSGYEGNVVDLLQGHPPFVLGGKRVEKQVVKLLTAELTLGAFERESSFERMRGAEWWERYVEGPAERGLKETLSRGVPRRTNETDEEYDARLHSIELRMRARLPSYERVRAWGMPP